MGRLHYDGTNPPISIDDVTLTHLKVVIGTKLRRHESFLMTWLPGDGGKDGRRTVWIHPSIPLQFGFDEEAGQPVDPHRIAEIMGALNASGELNLDPLCIHDDNSD